MTLYQTKEDADKVAAEYAKQCSPEFAFHVKQLPDGWCVVQDFKDARQTRF